MADKEVIEDEVVVSEDDDETHPDLTEQHDSEEPDDAGDEGDDSTESGPEDSDEVTVTFGEEAPSSEEDETQAKPWVRELRKSSREKDRKIRELEAKLNATVQPAVTAAPAKKPTLAECEYDEEVFESKLETWHKQKLEADSSEAKKKQAEESAHKEWHAKLDAHAKKKAALKVKDFDDAEEAVQDAFSQTQLGIIVDGADNSAALLYALGKNPMKLKELSSITNPVKFTFALAKLESQMKVTPRKSVPLPERVVQGSAPSKGAMDSKLARLEAEADKSGDRTRVVAYKMSLRGKK